VLPVLWTTSCFQMQRMRRIRDDVYFSSSSLGGRAGGVVCRVGLHPVDDAFVRTLLSNLSVKE